MPHYLQIASRKLLLFHSRRNLAPRGQRRRQQQQQQQQQPGASELVMRLSDLVNSPVMAELQELLLLGPGAELERDLYSNWFSLQVCHEQPRRLCRMSCSRQHSRLLGVGTTPCFCHSYVQHGQCMAGRTATT